MFETATSIGSQSREANPGTEPKLGVNDLVVSSARISRLARSNLTSRQLASTIEIATNPPFRSSPTTNTGAAVLLCWRRWFKGKP